MDPESNLIAHLNPEFVFTIGGFVPSKQPNYKTDGGKTIIDVWFKPTVLSYEREVRARLETILTESSIFPTTAEVHVSITIGVHTKEKYDLIDLDNRCKTILDAFKGPIYGDDKQVKFLSASKEMVKGQEDWCLFAVKLL